MWGINHVIMTLYKSRRGERNKNKDKRWQKEETEEKDWHNFIDLLHHLQREMWKEQHNQLIWNYRYNKGTPWYHHWVRLCLSMGKMRNSDYEESKTIGIRDPRPQGSPAPTKPRGARPRKAADRSVPASDIKYHLYTRGSRHQPAEGSKTGEWAPH